jgi:hypothetical protein
LDVLFVHAILFVILPKPSFFLNSIPEIYHDSLPILSKKKPKNRDTQDRNKLCHEVRSPRRLRGYGREMNERTYAFRREPDKPLEQHGIRSNGEEEHMAIRKRGREEGTGRKEKEEEGEEAKERRD